MTSNSSFLTIKHLKKKFSAPFKQEETTPWAINIPKNHGMRFRSGRITAIIGPNGAGKTTLFNLITGALVPEDGEIIYDGNDLAGLEPYQIARAGIGRLFQDIRIFGNLTLQENILSACWSHREEMPWTPFFLPSLFKRRLSSHQEKIRNLLNLVELYEKRDRKAYELSFGEQKMLAIARLLAAEFPVLLLDEPTAGLNPHITKKMKELLAELIKKDQGKTIVIVEHDMRFISDLASWTYFMRNGKNEFEGRTDHVLENTNVRKKFLGY